MAEEPSAVRSVVTLVETARLHPAGALPLGTHQSYPIPVPDPKGLRVAFLYCRAEIVEAKQGLQLWPPSYVAFLEARTGRFERLATLTADDRGQDRPADRPLGSYLTLAERMTDTFLTQQVRLYQAYDDLLPAFAARPGDVPPEVVRSILEFEQLFPRVTEGPLLPHYQVIGKEFFAWLRRTKSSG